MRGSLSALVGIGLLVVSCRSESTRPGPTTPSADDAEPPRPPEPVRAPLAVEPWITGTATVGGRFALEVRVEPYETFVDARPLEGRDPSWHWRPTSRDLRVRWGSEGPSESSLAILQTMLGYLVSERGLDLAEVSLRTELSPYGYSSYAERLARFAAGDPEWRRSTEGPGRGSSALHRYVLKITREQRLHPELDALFEPWRSRPRLESVEKCLRSARGADADTRRWLRARKLPTQRSLPLGCLMANLRLETPPRAIYLANAGVMVASGPTKILFDPFFRNDFGLYELVPEGIERALMEGEQPFDGVDALFVSHHHEDHFSPEVVAAYLRAQPEVVMVGPAAAVSALVAAGGPTLRARTRALHLRLEDAPAEIAVGPIKVEATRVPHAGWPSRHRDVANLAYRVELDGGVRVVHLGDADPKREHFERHRDHWAQDPPPTAAFPPYWFFASSEGRSILKGHVRADLTVGVHVPADVPDLAEQRPPELRDVDVFTRPEDLRWLSLRP